MGALRGLVAGLSLLSGLLCPAVVHAQDDPPPPTPALSIGVSPTSVSEDVQRAFVVSATYTSVGAGSIVVHLLTDGSACPAQPPFAGQVDGTANVADGSGTRTFNGQIFDETAPRTRRVCAYLRDGGGNVVRRADATITIREPSVNLSISRNTPNLIEGAPAGVSTSGTSEAPRRVWLYVRGTVTGAAPVCAATADAMAAAGGRLVFATLPATSLAGSGDFTIPGRNNVICAYVGELPADAALEESQSFTARAPVVSGLSLETSSSSTVEDLPVQLTIRLQNSEVARTLYVLAQNGGTSCAATALEQLLRPGTTSVGGGRSIGMGSRITEPFAPPGTGTWRVCAYVTGAEDRQPDVAPATLSVVARAPSGRLSVSAPPGPVVGSFPDLVATGEADTARRVFLFVGGDRECAPTALSEANRGNVTALTPEEGAPGGPGAFSESRRVSVVGTTPFRLCAYLSEFPSAPPLAVATTLVVPQAGPAPPTPPPPPPAPPGVGTPPGREPVPPGFPPGYRGWGGEFDFNPGPIPDEVGDRAQGSFWVNNTVMPAGITATRFVVLARRSGERWGYKFRGVTSKGAAKRDGRRVIGFSSAVTPSQRSRIIVFRKRLARPKWCGSSRSGRCRIRYRVVEREIALARKAPNWWDGGDHPPADHLDIESALLRMFGILAGNTANDPACSGTPLLRSSGVTEGWWWRSPQDYFRPRCPAPSA